MPQTITPAFAEKFRSYVCFGDSISVEIESFEIKARIEFDQDTRPEDSGFDPEDEDYGEENARICASWKNDEWHYCGVVLSVSKAGVVLDDHAAALWGIECNFPFGNGAKEAERNSYLTDVANELLPEALSRARGVLSMLLSPAEADAA